ncbi:hypothetical protein C8034_v004214 [Colletotrichum sidae]|uniref:Uncharacterized protein n=1 Tax=Colletotrichum sidae TaxID=1347389 RepID=A0A4R8TNA9_9PEZI|nr:hypothetical protein C8034_v004214 [Colletotrichum sidae]
MLFFRLRKAEAWLVPSVRGRRGYGYQDYDKAKTTFQLVLCEYVPAPSDSAKQPYLRVRPKAKESSAGEANVNKVWLSFFSSAKAKTPEQIPVPGEIPFYSNWAPTH